MLQARKWEDYNSSYLRLIFSNITRTGAQHPEPVKIPDGFDHWSLLESFTWCLLRPDLVWMPNTNKVFFQKKNVILDCPQQQKDCGMEAFMKATKMASTRYCQWWSKYSMYCQHRPWLSSSLLLWYINLPKSTTIHEYREKETVANTSIQTLVQIFIDLSTKCRKKFKFFPLHLRNTEHMCYWNSDQYEQHQNRCGFNKILNSRRCIQQDMQELLCQFKEERQLKHEKWDNGLHHIYLVMVTQTIVFEMVLE